MRWTLIEGKEKGFGQHSEVVSRLHDLSLSHTHTHNTFTGETVNSVWPVLTQISTLVRQSLRSGGVNYMRIRSMFSFII